MNKDYDSSWDNQCTSSDEDAFQKIYAKWSKRSWESWLRKNLVFPFTVERMEDADEPNPFDMAEPEPFQVGHIMEAIEFEKIDDFHGILLIVKNENTIGRIPLCDVEVTSKKNVNYWPVREYVVWFANS